MWTISDLLLSFFGITLAFAVVMLFVRAFWPAEVQYDLDDNANETLEARFRKVNAEDVG